MKVPQADRIDFNELNSLDDDENENKVLPSHGSVHTPVATVNRSSETGYAKRFLDKQRNTNIQYIIVRVQDQSTFSNEDELVTYFMTEKVGNQMRIRVTDSSLFPEQGKISYPHQSNETYDGNKYYIVNAASVVETTHASAMDADGDNNSFITVRNPDGNHYMTTQQSLHPVNFDNSNDILSTLMPVLKITKYDFENDKKHLGYLQADSLTKDFKSKSEYRDFIDVNKALKGSFLVKIKGIKDLFGPFETDDEYDLHPVEIKSGFPYIYKTPADVFRELPNQSHLYNYRLNKMYVNNNSVTCFMADVDIIENCIDQYISGQEKEKALEEVKRSGKINSSNIEVIQKALKYHQGKEDFFYIPTITYSIISRLQKNILPDVHQEVVVSEDKKQELLILELQNHNKSLLDAYIILEKERNAINQQLATLEMENREKIRRLKTTNTQQKKDYDELKYKNDKKIDALQKRVAQLEIELHKLQSSNTGTTIGSDISHSELAQLEVDILNKQRYLETLQTEIETKNDSLKMLEKKTASVIEHYKQDQQDLVDKLLEFSPMLNILTDVLPMNSKSQTNEINPKHYLVAKNTKSASLISTLDKVKLRNKMVSHAYNYLLHEQYWIDPKILSLLIASLGQGLMTTLYGKPGSGKTTLALMIAEIFKLNNSFKRIPIPHGLQSGDDFIGFIDATTGKFKPQHNGFYELLQLASDLKKYSDTRPVMALLDEANLSRMEYYLSDFIIDWDRKDIDLTHIIGEHSTRPLILSNNFKIISTLNSDETRNPIPLRIRERMNYIHLEAYNTGRATAVNEVFIDEELEFSYTHLDDAFAHPTENRFNKTIVKTSAELQLSIRRKNSWNRLYYGVKDLEVNDQKVFQSSTEALDYTFMVSSLHTLDLSTDEKSRIAQNVLNTNDLMLSYNMVKNSNHHH